MKIQILYKGTEFPFPNFPSPQSVYSVMDLLANGGSAMGSVFRSFVKDSEPNDWSLKIVSWEDYEITQPLKDTENEGY